MAIAMSLVQIIARLGFAPNLASAWLTSFAIGVAVAIPTAILVTPRAQRLAGNLTGAPRRPPPDKRRERRFSCRAHEAGVTIGCASSSNAFCTPWVNTSVSGQLSRSATAVRLSWPA